MKKSAVIFGDSYSTFEGCIPDGYATHYTKNGDPETDVTKVTETWWHQVAEEANLSLILNDSWAGSTICYTGYENEDCSASSSFIYRLRQLIKNGFFTEHKIDAVFVFGGTNDSWSDAPLGEMMYHGWEEKDLYCVRPAVCYFLHLLRETLPHVPVYCLINTGIKPEVDLCIKEACKAYDMIPVTFDRIDKGVNHPSIQGMKEIKDGTLRAMKQ